MTIAADIQNAIGTQALTDIGASNFKAYADGLVFNARIRKPGTEQVRKMTAKVIFSDPTYTIVLHYLEDFDFVNVLDLKGIFAAELPNIFTHEYVEATANPKSLETPTLDLGIEVARTTKAPNDGIGHLILDDPQHTLF